MSKTNVSSSGSRILRVLKALRGHALNGISNGELATALHESRQTSTGHSTPSLKKGWL